MFVLLMNRSSGGDTDCKSVKSGGNVKKAVKSPPSGKSTPSANGRDHNVDNGNSDKKDMNGKLKKLQHDSVSCIEHDVKEDMEAQIHPMALLSRQDPTQGYGRIDLLSHVPSLRLVIPNIENIFNTNEHRRLKMTYLGKKYSIDEFFGTLDLDSQTRGEIT